MAFKSSITPLSSSSNSRKRSGSNRITTDRSKNPRNIVGKSPFVDIGSYMMVKNRKLQDQFNADAASSSATSFGADGGNGGGRKGIFVGISIFVDGFTVPSSQELKGYMLKHGGRYQNYFSRRSVTHIICTHLPDSKMRNLRAFSRGLPIVKPDWVVDSVTANKLLNWVPYQMDALKNESSKQQKLISFFATKSISSFNNAGASSHSDALPCKDDKLKLLLLDEGECSKSKEQFAFLERDTLCQVEDAEHSSTDIGGQNIKSEVEISAACVRKESFEEPLYMLYPEVNKQKQVMVTSTIPNSCGNYSKGSKESDSRQIQLSSRSDDYQISRSPGQPQSIMPQSVSQLDLSVLRELPEEMKADILKSLPRHRTLHFSMTTSGNMVKNFSGEIKDQNSESPEVCLWKGTPPNWVEKFKLSNCCLLNVFAMLYSRSETNGPFSVVLQSSNSFLPAADDVNSEEWDETLSSLCELFKQYIELKIESDMEELFVCFQLLRRYALVSKLVSQAYNLVLPFLQASLSEIYGGTFKFSVVEELSVQP